MKKVLSIAGSDCSGGAGIQADLKTFCAHRVFGMSVIVSVVAENTSRVIAIEDASPDMIRKQVDAVFEDIGTDAVKVGMLSTSACMAAVADRLAVYRPANVVIDPVMYAKNGCPLMEADAMDTLMERIIPLADVLTPNIPEAEKIAGMRIASVADMEEAAEKIWRLGCRNVVVKGGHAKKEPLDVLFDGKKLYHFKAQRIMTKNTHGTGCTFSAAIAARLAGGADVRDAVAGAKEYVTGAIAHALEIGKGNGPTNHFYAFYGGPDRQKDKAYDYSLYLVADEGAAKGLCLAEAVEQAILGGATMVQLREKEASALDFYRLADQIRAVTKKYGVPLIINDRVDVALAVRADGVHVGQRDIPAAVVRRMIGEEMLLGVSAVNVREAVRAQEEGADYLGVGAMFPTETKPDAAAVSMEELLKIRQAVKLPIVAIGGINRENAAQFGKTGVDGLAVASSILSRPDVKGAAAELKMRLFSAES